MRGVWALVPSQAQGNLGNVLGEGPMMMTQQADTRVGILARIVVATLGAVLALSASARADEKAHWTYGGETGPQHWIELEESSSCAGERQSPVNIIPTENDPTSRRDWPLVLRYPAETHIHDVVNNGHSIQYDFDCGDEIDFGGMVFELKQIHFHEPSEHTLNGVRYPIERHLVRFNADIGEYVVLGVMGIEGAENEAYGFLEQYLPIAPRETKIIDRAFSMRVTVPNELMPRYHYRGSLTTPPCTESVNWVIFEKSFMLSFAQVQTLQQPMPVNNYRSTQPLNGRAVSLVVH
jgi:carbonic anhydrase